MQDLNAINTFLQSVNKMVPHIDILINNAAQTLSRPAAFYNYLHIEATQVLEGPKAEKIMEVCTTLDLDKIRQVGKSLNLECVKNTKEYRSPSYGLCPCNRRPSKAQSLFKAETSATFSQ